MPRRIGALAVVAMLGIAGGDRAVAQANFVPLVDVLEKSTEGETYPFVRCVALYLSLINGLGVVLEQDVSDAAFEISVCLATLAAELRMDADDVSVDTAAFQIRGEIAALVELCQSRMKANEEAGRDMIGGDELYDSDIATCGDFVQIVSDAGFL